MPLNHGNKKRGSKYGDIFERFEGFISTLDACWPFLRKNLKMMI